MRAALRAGCPVIANVTLVALPYHSTGPAEEGAGLLGPGKGTGAASAVLFSATFSCAASSLASGKGGEGGKYCGGCSR